MPKNKKPDSEISPITIEMKGDLQELRLRIKRHSRYKNLVIKMLVSTVILPPMMLLAYKYRIYRPIYHLSLWLIKAIYADPNKFREILVILDQANNVVTEDFRKLLLSVYLNYEHKLANIVELKSLPLVELYEQIDQKYIKIKNLQDHSVPLHQEILFSYLAGKLMLKRALNINFLLTLVVEYFVVDPLVDMLLPYGINSILRGRFSLPRNLSRQVLTKKDYEALHKELEQLDQDLSFLANANIFFAIIISVVLLPYAFNLVMKSEFETSPYTMSFSAAFLTTVLCSVCSGVQGLWQKWNLSSELKSQANIIREIVGSQLEGFVQIEGQDVSSSGFRIQCKDSQTLSAAKIAELLKHCLIVFGIKVDFQRDNVVGISADGKINSKNAKKIKELFNESITRKVETKELTQQVYELKEISALRITQFLKIPEDDNQHLPTMRFKIFLQSNAAVDILQQVFTSHHPEISEEGGQFVLTISGHKTIEPQRLQQMKQNLKTDSPSMEKKTPTWILNNLNKGEKLLRGPRAKQESGREDTNTENKQPQQLTLRVVKWKSGEFDSSKYDRETSLVHPRPLGNTHSESSYNNARYFIKDALDWSQVPKKITNELRNKIKDMPFKRAKGAQGIVFWNRKELDQTGNPFTARAKLKFKGQHGDVRIFLEAEESKDGTLLVGKGIDVKSH